ncbi:hypothetical protein MMC17_003078 [Xylographa soralifera]|nr:hypothetical protein [Xylographa soralifera]
MSLLHVDLQRLPKSSEVLRTPLLPNLLSFQSLFKSSKPCNTQYLPLLFLTILLSFCPTHAVSSITSPCPLLTTPTYGLTSAVFTACANTSIACPAAEIAAILLDFANYYHWNTFVIVAALVSSPSSTPTTPHFDGVEVGDVYNFTTQGLLPGGALTYSQELITVLPGRAGDWSERGRNYTMAWRSYNSGVLAEHVSIITEIGEWNEEGKWCGSGKSYYDSWETYYGPAAVDVFEEVGLALETQFVVQGEDLKTWAEGGSARVSEGY